MSLKKTIAPNGKPSSKEMEKILTQTGLKDPVAFDNEATLKTEKVDKTIKINVLLSETDHTMFKLHCKINRINMQEKGKELILEWLSKQPKLGI